MRRAPCASLLYSSRSVSGPESLPPRAPLLSRVDTGRRPGGRHGGRLLTRDDVRLEAVAVTVDVLHRRPGFS